ncbi:hypothetical protein PSACC_02355 [Paramicrosporidium saccamoebae]|uniref:Uncharacterized protein n=1 Tax=Paramicrosporidium saccamoebae TaxID=1246581 RepID=A0A2H9TJB3_9FUNG|nr:hypothetical protein PSACC_02355 [Paramicrosporidium saccamoebae]
MLLPVPGGCKLKRLRKTYIIHEDCLRSIEAPSVQQVRVLNQIHMTNALTYVLELSGSIANAYHTWVSYRSLLFNAIHFQKSLDDRVRVRIHTKIVSRDENIGRAEKLIIEVSNPIIFQPDYTAYLLPLDEFSAPYTAEKAYAIRIVATINQEAAAIDPMVAAANSMTAVINPLTTVIDPRVCNNVLRLLMREFWKNDNKVFFGISLRFFAHNKVLIRLFYPKSVSYALARRNVHDLWSNSTRAILQNFQFAYEPCTTPMPTPPESYRQDKTLVLQVGTSPINHVINENVFHDLNMRFVFHRGHQNIIWLAGNSSPFYHHDFQLINVFHPLLQRDQVESWRAPVYHILLWILQTPESTCHAIKFTILDDHSVKVKVMCVMNIARSYLDALYAYYEIE